MSRRIALPLAVVLAALALASCGKNTSTETGNSGTTTPAAQAPGGSTPTMSLTGTSWTLVSYQGPANVEVPAAPAAVAPLTFGADDALTGSTGCNQFAGTYRAEATNLTITLGPMTLAGCTSAVLTAQEAALTKLLPQVTSYTLTSDALTLAADGKTLLTYTPGLVGLEGTSWNVTGLNNGKGGVETSAATEALTAAFDTAGAFSGFGGCNQFAGTYTTTTPDGLTISGVSATQKACAADVTAAETQYVNALGKVSTYSINGDQLTLRDSTGATQITLRLSR